MVRRRVLCAAAALVVVAAPASAQVDLSGSWNTRQHEDQPDRGPGVGLGDYTGMPITEGARLWAESWDAARLSEPEQQCRVHAAHYIYRGPLNLRIWEEKDPKTQEVLAIKHYISTYEQTRTIWMDGRPHPPEYAPHTWMGFSTGRWDGDRLIVETTHIKQGWHRRNGVPASDRTTMTEYFIRHGNYFTHIEVIRDPVYLTEPMVKSQQFELNLRALPERNWLWPCQAVVEVATREETDVAHYLPGRNPYLASSRKAANLPSDGAAGGAETLYPEWITDKATAAQNRSRSAGSATGPTVARVPTDEVRVWPVQSNVYMLVGPGGNSTVQIGDDGVLLVDTKLAGMSDTILAAIKTLTNKPIRYVVNTHDHDDHIGANEPIAKAGSTRTGGVVVGQIGSSAIDTAAIAAHENVLKRVSAPTGTTSPIPFAAWPTETYFGDHRDFMFNGEGIELVHVANAHTDGDSMVFFRRSDVISTGDVFVTTGYPVIDASRGGSVQGILKALNTIIKMAIPSGAQEGGTMIVPGHGRVSDEMDVVEYRGMVTIVRDRVQDMIDRGLSLEQVRAARPTLDFDARYGAEAGPWTTTMFVDAVYQDLMSARGRR